MAHAHFLSVYDIANESWVKHVVFEGGDIRKFFAIKNKKGKETTGAILKNGSVIFADNYTDPDFVVISKEEAKFKIKEEIVKIYEDVKHLKVLFVVCKNSEGKLVLKCIYKDKFSDLPGLDSEWSNMSSILRVTNTYDTKKNCSDSDLKYNVHEHYYITKDEYLYKYKFVESN